MAKKRRDKERDSSTVSKIAKVAALTVSVGAAYFSIPGLNKKLTSEYIPALSKAKNIAAKELRNSKALRKGLDKHNTGKDIQTALKLGKETFKKELTNIKTDKIKIHANDKTSLAGALKHVRQLKDHNSILYGLKEAYDSEHRARAITTLTQYFPDINPKTINAIAQDAFRKIEENTVFDENNNLGFTDFLSKRFRKAGLDKNQEHLFLEYIYKYKKDNIGDPKDFRNIKNQLENVKKKIGLEFDQTIIESKRRSDTIYGKLDALAKKYLNKNIDSEMQIKKSRPLTLKDFKELLDKDKFDKESLGFRIKNEEGLWERRTFKYELEQYKDLADDIIFDKNIRIDANGDIYDVSKTNDILKEAFNSFSDTTLGRIFALTDIRLNTNTEKETFAIFKAFSTGKEVGYEQGAITGKTILSHAKVAISNPTTGKAKLFDLSLNDNDTLEMSDAIAEGILRNNMHGKSARLNKEMLGSNKDLLHISEDEWAKRLDLKQNGAPTLFEKLKSGLSPNKGDEYGKEIIFRQKKFFTSDADTEEKLAQATLVNMQYAGDKITPTTFLDAQAETANRILKDTRKVSEMLNNITAMNKVTDESIASLLQAGTLTDEDGIKMLEVLNNKEYSSAEELLNLISNYGSDNFLNPDLKNIIGRGISDYDYINNMQNISKVNLPNILGKTIGSTNVMDSEEVIKREIIKEVMLRESAGGGFVSGIDQLENILENSNLVPEQAKNLRYLSNWAIMQTQLNLANDTDAIYELNQLVGQGSPLNKFDELISHSQAFKQGYSNMLDDLSSRVGRWDAEIGNINQSYSNEYNKYTFMNRSVLSRLDQIKDVNDAIKALGQAANELTAGRNNLNDYTTLTQIPQFMVSRLSWALEGIGLNLSNNSTGSTLDIIKNIGLKRILPVASSIAVYNYLNFESENFTGSSITGAGANALANIDLASRRLAYATPVGKIIDWFKEPSVIAEYWTGSNDYDNLDERKEWYKDGYSPVRQGRLWGFGSSNEYRGGNIQYYQPNYLKRAHSDYYNKSVYDSTNEKYKHSWIPTPRHPLSPLRALWNPYWLEEKHIDDRPYPLTGKLFTEGTPWGAILNPTVGEIIKPVKMLHQNKRRLGKDGRDIRNVLRELNDRIKRKGKNQKDVLMFEGTDLRNARYYSYANPGDNSMNINIANGKTIAPGVDFLSSSHELTKSDVPTGEIVANNIQQSDLINPNSQIIKEITNVSYDTKKAVNSIINGINNAIKTIGKDLHVYRSNTSPYIQPLLPDRSAGTYVYTNLVNQMNQRNLNYYETMKTPYMVNKSIGADYLKDATWSVRELSGIYNFFGDLAFGEDSYTFKYAQAGDVTSFSRRFWDASVGGIGGEVMEIARRFFPSEDKSIVRYNPLRNTMPEWLPQKFLTGDPYTSLPKGEMRLPGKGYESINPLHPDMFSFEDGYGAFDRFKILADIAPTSEEYKLWRNIARNTITDPTLIKQMDKIQSRATRISGKHEFYDYRYRHNNTKVSKGVIKNINGSIITLVSGEQLNLAGIELTQDADVGQVLHSGEHIKYQTSANAIKRLEDGLITNAVIYKSDFGMATNINKELINIGMATKNENDRSAISYLANASGSQQILGSIGEFIAHANIPIIHNKFLKIETARESFENEQIYGSQFTTWDHPIKGFLRPAFNNISKQGILRHALSVGTAFTFANIDKITDQPLLKFAAGAATALTNPTALIGMGAAGVWNLGIRAVKNTSKTNIELGAGIGATAGSIAWGWNNADNPLKAALAFSIAGENIFKYLKMDELGFKQGKGALIGAAIGLGISAIKNPRMSKDMFKWQWTPHETKKKWELDEYFDRLEYIKYLRLYNQAANRAAILEKSNIRSIINKIDKNKDKIAKFTRKAEKLSNKYTAEGYEYNEKMQKLTTKIQALESQQTILRHSGKYTKAAIAYKKAMESTIYGLREGATQDEILGAVPDQYKDYFMRFMNETDKKERKKILKMLPEYLRKPLKIAWNQKSNRIESNRKFFKHHKLPNIAWRGWKPNINLKHVKMKTIQNEGMLLSDFGYYESEKAKSQYTIAPDIEYYNKEGKGTLGYMSSMSAALSGLGVTVQNISVEPTSSPGLWIVGDIKQTLDDTAKIASYGTSIALDKITSALF